MSNDNTWKDNLPDIPSVEKIEKIFKKIDNAMRNYEDNGGKEEDIAFTVSLSLDFAEHKLAGVQNVSGPLEMLTKRNMQDNNRVGAMALSEARQLSVKTATVQTLNQTAETLEDHANSIRNAPDMQELFNALREYTEEIQNLSNEILYETGKQR